MTLHACSTPTGEQPPGVDPGDLWMCSCGRHWRAVAAPDGLAWQAVGRVRGFVTSLTRLGIPYRSG